MVKLPSTQKDRFLGFKFVLPVNYPVDAPLVYLDEPINQEVIDMIDYLEAQNRIMFEYVILWGKKGLPIVNQLQQYNLNMLLTKLYQIMS